MEIDLSLLKQTWGIYMKEDILLTISILVSGREETRKCLDSLKELRNEIPCELILTDTGCPEEMKEWLKEYTDRIYSFAWCNDFAAARNVGLKNARGKWFLYMDDDEWFEDTSDIIRFFKSGEYEQYRMALYKVRNYGDRAGISFKDSYVSRMSELTRETEFIFPIHEVLMPGNAPAKYLEDYVHHYGYAYESEDAEREKHKRNLPLLLKAHEDDKHCLRHNAQLILEYYSLENYAKALEVAYEGVRDFDHSFFMNERMLNVCYASIVRSLNCLGNYTRAMEEAERFIQEEKISALAVGFICGEAVFSCLKLHENDKGLLYLKQYLLLKDAFEEDKACFMEQQTVVLENCFDEGRYQWIIVNGVVLAAKMGNLEKIEDTFQRETVLWWEATLAGWCLLQPAEQMKEFREALETLDDGKELCPMFFWLRITGNMLTGDRLKDLNLEELKALLDEYAEKCTHYYRKLYAPVVLMRNRSLLPGEFRMAELLQESGKELSNGNYIEALKKLKKAIPMFQSLGQALHRYAELLAEQYRQEQKEKQLKEERNTDQEEFLQLAAQIKGRIRSMLEQKKYVEARAAIDQLRMLLPGDRELNLLEQQLPE